MKKSAFLLSLLLLTACGFQPMYGSYSGGGSETSSNALLANIAIGNVPDREGQILRNDLIDRFYKDGRPSNPTYTLNFTKLTETIRELDLTRESENTRSQIQMTTQMTLVDSGGKVLLSRSLVGISSFNELESQFATRVTEADAREAVIRDLARQAERIVVLYFNNPTAPE